MRLRSENFDIHQFYLFLLFVGGFLILLLWNPTLYDTLSREDNVFEYLSSIALAVTGILFIKSYLVSKKVSYKSNYPYTKYIFLGIGLIFFIVAGEEISWGQRIFNIATPNFLLEVNDQNELNLHNVDKRFFDRLVDRVIILFVVIGTVLVLMKKEKVWGVMAPSIITICIFAMTPFYNQYNNLDFEFYHIIYIPLVLLLYYVISEGEKRAFLVVFLTVLVTFILAAIHTKYNFLFPSHNNSANEYREYLFSLSCLFYAYIIFKDQHNSIKSNTL